MQKQVGIEKLTENLLKLWFNMQYNTYHCFTCANLFEPVNPAKWNINEKLALKYGARTKRDFCGWVLTYFFYLVFLDMIKNNITFEFPLFRDKSAMFYIKCFQDDEFKRLYAKGKFMGIDFIASEFKGYQIFYQWRKGSKFKEKPVYISNNIKYWFYDKINSGKQYY